MNPKSLFQHTLSQRPERLHFAAHSHHPWPDVTRAAQLRAWDDAARDLDEKWGPLFEELWPRCQARIAARLGLDDGSSLAFSANTHDFLLRIASCRMRFGHLRVLTTDAEFHSARRQLERWEEAGQATLSLVAAEPFESFPERFTTAAQEGAYDLVWCSHVFFDSGYVVPDLAAIADALPDDDTLIVFDGYHAFNALPVDLAPVAERCFYVGGAYKYAMAGEGACFLHCPPGYGERPVVTGWFAGFGSLAHDGSGQAVGYGPGGTRFLGSTFDPVGLYRLDAALGVLDEHGLDPATIHAHVRKLQQVFLAGLPATGSGPCTHARLLPGRETRERGHFLTFRTPQAEAAQQRLREVDVITDHRRDRLRIGFGIYHDEHDVRSLLERVHGLWPGPDYPPSP